MLANVELPRDFFVLNQQCKGLAAALIERVELPSLPFRVGAGEALAREGERIYRLASGTLGARYRGRTVYSLEEGDLLLPDIAGSGGAAVDAEDGGGGEATGKTPVQTHDQTTGQAAAEYAANELATGAGEDAAASAAETAENEAQAMTVSYLSESGAVLAGYPALEFVGRVLADRDASRLWTRLLVTQAGMQLRLAAALTEEDARAAPNYAVYHPGEVIIRQGERADYVFNLTEGTAEVAVDGVTVSSIGEGEIFGAMAVLTNAERSATVCAKTRCAVVKVPGGQFTELIRSNPATIHSLLADMANSIVKLNQQLVGLRGSAMN